MKCSNCGLPLSPSRTQCPRCGAVAGAPARKGSIGQGAAFLPGNSFSPVSLPLTPIPTGSTNTPIPPGPEQLAGGYGPSWPESTTTPQAFVTDNSPFAPPVNPQPSMYAQEPAHPFQNQGWSSAPSAQGWTPNIGRPQASGFAFVQTPRNPVAPGTTQKTVRSGFLLAGLCIVTGALILIFVSIMAQNLPSGGTSSPQTSAPQTAVVNTPTPLPTQPTPTPTPTFPGKQYLDNPQMATQLNEQTKQVVTYGTTFQTGQKIFITFSAHPGGQAGYACLNWYLNNASITSFPLFIDGAANYPVYAYSVMHGTGNGYVEVYWSLKEDCSKGLLAFRADFTVNA